MSTLLSPPTSLYWHLLWLIDVVQNNRSLTELSDNWRDTHGSLSLYHQLVGLISFRKRTVWHIGPLHHVSQVRLFYSQINENSNKTVGWSSDVTKENLIKPELFYLFWFKCTAVRRFGSPFDCKGIQNSIVIVIRGAFSVLIHFRLF